jgi:pimeloyl-ACP methyl ester carboxylesterase
MEGQMYVERFVPEAQTQAHPVVMIHGGGQTGTNFTATPDGRRGWLHDFLRAGYTVYVADQPERARSGHPTAMAGDHSLTRSDADRIEKRFTAPEVARLWPQASLHTQWPGLGVRGEAAFDTFFASQVEQLESRAAIEAACRDACVALLAEIGPAILLVHSQSGPVGWAVTDTRPDLVTAILCVEPNGPPFYETVFKGGDDWYEYEDAVYRPWGIACIPLTFEPPLDDPKDLNPVPDPDHPGGDGLVHGYVQSEPARRLVRLAGIPIMLLTAEASFRATYDHATSRFLAQAGVTHDFIRLEDRGIRGNAHMMMCELNNHEIADLMIGWLEEKRGD